MQDGALGVAHVSDGRRQGEKFTRVTVIQNTRSRDITRECLSEPADIVYLIHVSPLGARTCRRSPRSGANRSQGNLTAYTVYPFQETHFEAAKRRSNMTLSAASQAKGLLQG